MRQAASGAANCQTTKLRASCDGPQTLPGAWPFQCHLGDVNDGRIADRIDPKRSVEVAFPARQIDDQQLPAATCKITCLAFLCSIAFGDWVKDLKSYKTLTVHICFFALGDFLIQRA